MSESYDKSFAKLDQLLCKYQHLWRLSPFIDSRSQIENLSTLPKSVKSTISQYTLQDIEQIKSTVPIPSSALGDEFQQDLQQLESLIVLPLITSEPMILPRNYDVGIPGRKKQQIVNFASSAFKLQPKLPFLEWCAGKGYLGRILHWGSSQQIKSVEYQVELCKEGQHFADTHKLDMEFTSIDVFQPSAKLLVQHEQHAVALHACGDLHHHLIELGATNGTRALTVSPCCYHLINSNSYRPLSNLARQSTLDLTKQDLRIPLQETVTGGKRVARHRQLEMTYRLALDELLRRELNLDNYIPFPSIKKSLLSNGFEAFCLWATEQKNIDIGECDWDYYLAEGEQRFLRMEQLNLVIQPFMRPLELWLALDKVNFLKEMGYQVQLEIFCDRNVTPRNLLIQAKK